MIGLTLTVVILQGFLCSVLGQERPQFRVIKEWNYVNYTWPTMEAYNEAISNKEYVPNNIVISGVMYYDGYYYLSLPRMKEGVTATLARVQASGNPRPLLEPYPSWEMNKLGDCNAIQNSQNVEIDSSGQMWIIDGGRTLTLNKDPVTTCGPKLIIYDIKNNKTTRVFNFPEDVVGRTTSFLYDLVVDDIDGGYAYITDNSGKDPGIVVYSLRQNKSWKIRHSSSMKADPDMPEFKIDGVSIKTPINIAGIALGPKFVIDNTSLTIHEDRPVYYAPLSSTHLYSIESSDLRMESNSNNGGEFQGHVEDIGVKSSPTDGMIMDDTGVLYYGLLSDSSVARWNTQTSFASGQDVISRDAMYIQWPNSFTFDNNGNVILLTNRLHKFVYGKMDINEPNFRLMSARTGTKSYISIESPLQYTVVDSTSSTTKPTSDKTGGPIILEDRAENDDSSSLDASSFNTSGAVDREGGGNFTVMRDGSLGTKVSGFEAGRRDGSRPIDPDRTDAMTTQNANPNEPGVITTNPLDRAGQTTVSQSQTTVTQNQTTVNQSETTKPTTQAASSATSTTTRQTSTSSASSTTTSINQKGDSDKNGDILPKHDERNGPVKENSASSATLAFALLLLPAFLNLFMR